MSDLNYFFRNVEKDVLTKTTGLDQYIYIYIYIYMEVYKEIKPDSVKKSRKEKTIQI